MDIVCSCSCGARFKVGAQAAGKKARCPKCQAIIVVPGEPVAVVPAVALPPVSRPAAAAPPPVRAALPAPVAAAPIATPLFSDAPATPSAGRAKFERKPKSNALALMIGGGAAVSVILIGVLALMLSGGGEEEAPPVGKRPPGKNRIKEVLPGTLVIEWPEAERTDASLQVNGRNETLPLQGPIELKVPPGKYVVGIRRKNFQVVRWDAAVISNGTESFRPEWIVASIPAPVPNDPPAIASNDPPTKSPTDPSGDEPSRPFIPVQPEGRGASKIEGFAGWFEDVNEAQRSAREGQGILIVVGSSDGSPQTGRLADALKAAGLPDGDLGKQFVPVVIDIPVTQEAQDRLFDPRQSVYNGLQYLNLQKVQSYQDLMSQLPVLVLADEQGRPYSVVREWKEGVTNVGEKIVAMQAKRADRDKWLAALKNADDATGRLAAAASIAQWTLDEKLVVQYSNEIAEWLALVTKDDAKNEAGKLEVVIEARLYSQLLQPKNIDNPVQLARNFDVLNPFLSDIKFTNEERGAKLHVLAYRVLTELADTAQAQLHLERARLYDSMGEIPDFDPDVLAFGTGFVIAEGGYLLTNNHVVEGEGKLAVRVAGHEKPLPATLVHATKNPDIALIKVEFPEGMEPAPLSLADSKIRQAMKVAAFGYPRSDVLGDDLKVAEGIVSSLPNKRSQNMMVLDIRINPGNSGGPLCDMRGNVIGMVTAKTNLDGGDNFGMAIPTSQIDTFLKACLPPTAKRPKASKPGDAAKELDEATEIIAPSVLMVLKMK